MHRRCRRLWTHDGQACHDLVPPGSGSGKWHRQPPQHSTSTDAVLNVIGDHATWHRAENPLFHLDIEALAATVSGWHRTIASVETVSRDVVDGITAALQGQIASLIVPQDYQVAEPKPAKP